MVSSVLIAKHTTASTPRPHILYTVQVNVGGRELTAQRRYSEFVALHATLNDPYTLPPKRLLVTTFIPSAWVDDALIEERKAGLAEYLTDILSTPKYKDQAIVFEFLTTQTSERDQKFDLEDALPSTLTRTRALALAADVNGLTTASTMIAGAYYPDWAATAVPPESIDFTKFDLLFFAFATPTSTSGIAFGTNSVAMLKRLVAAAKASGSGTRIILSLGGWGGCTYFSQACSTPANRTKFVSAIATAINTYNLDGIDFDWEFPNNAGAGQPFSSADTANLLLVFKALRVSLGSCKIISAAASHTPWLGANGNPLTDVSAFAAVLNYVMIMNYDVWGASATPGPNAPIGNLCGTSTQPVASAQGGFKAWTTAKFPAAQLLLGLPLYGYVSKSTKTVLTGSLMPSAEMNVLHSEEAVGADGKPTTHFLKGGHAKDIADVSAPAEVSATATTTATANLTAYWGQQIAFKDIVKAGALVKKSDGNYGQAGGFTMAWDNCSDTPFLYNKAQTTVVTYDDTWSLADKAKFAKSNGMAGCCTWSLDQDDGLTLQKAIYTALGK
ncbi:glycoside hydrolase family 18 protein [Hypholoma sublateritium FD-334 SS-4]|uniref:Glycoside hydrolase family 18 protein n=1 Tax=Hypholoma sublateritium (strain FD-334 SS-4) TaxID=945553 RepID=A0A0D2MLZ4_HYPSF|nr:glycoside hydrolase family 18 protein [Hypholoma sublateritium FD-334 SS-4]